MDAKEFKKMLGEIAVENGFEKAYEGWFKEFPGIIQVLELQKSNFGNYYYLNIKIFIQGIFGKKFVKGKQLVKNATASIFCRPPDQYSRLLNLDESIEDSKRRDEIKEMFNDFIIPLSNNTTSRENIIDFYKKGEVFILPAVKEELGI